MVDVLASDYPPASSKRTKLAAGETKLDDITLGERGAVVVVSVLDKSDTAASDVGVMLLADPAGVRADARGSWLHHRAFRQKGFTSSMGNVRFTGVPRAALSHASRRLMAPPSNGQWCLPAKKLI